MSTDTERPITPLQAAREYRARGWWPIPYLALALEVATGIEAGHPDSLPSKATAASVPSRPIPCLHCAGTGQCDCISCGAMEPAMLWVPGKCTPCTATEGLIQ